MKLLRTIRLDPSDTFVFERVAEPGEWAVSGGFMFADADPEALDGKSRAAFRGGLLGVASLGWSTLAQIVEVDEKDRVAAIELTARCLIDRFGAPNFAAARKAAEEEIDFATSLCDHPLDTLIAVHRMVESGTIREAFRSLRPRGGSKPWQVFSFADVEVEDEPAETIDLATLAHRERR
jgi:Family of unknown function (DUF6505)